MAGTVRVGRPYREDFPCCPGEVPLYRFEGFHGFLFMGISRNDAQERPANLQTSLRRDVLIVVAVTLATFVLSSALDLREWVENFTGPLEAYQVDELPLTLLAMALTLAWFSWRRSKQVLEQVELRLVSEKQYRALFMETLAGNVVASMEGRIKLVNPAAAQLLGFAAAEDLNGHLLGDFYVDGDLWMEHRGRLLEMGLLVGTPIQLVRFAPMGDPVEIKIRGYHLTLRRHEAENIWVQLPG